MNWTLANSTSYSSSVQGGVVMLWVASSLLDIFSVTILYNKGIHVSQNVYELISHD